MINYRFTSLGLTILLMLVACTPLAAQRSTEPAQGEPIGKRLIFADGSTLDVDDAWKQADSVWYRRQGTSEMSNREVRKIENRYKKPEAATNGTAPAAANAAAPGVPAPAPSTWVYLTGGARLRVDEIREVADGAWYSRGKLTMFLDRERIARIEREQPETGATGWREGGWSSGNDRIDRLIKVNASRFGVDPYLVFCVIEQESQFKTFARSPKGAQGLMQLMPGTARRLGVRRPYDPSENIMGGVRYLKELLTMFDGRVDLALASYNAGEGAVMKYGRNVPPYRETREYVKKIGKRYGIDGRKPKEDTDTPVPQR
jgi:soluble lytic murein transglycosylase-like protein